MIKYFTSDTTNVMPAFVRLLGMKWIPCAAHLMNLVVTGGLKPVEKLVERASHLVRYFKKSVQMNELLISTFQELNDDATFPTLKQRNNTRWNSIHEMFLSLSENSGVLPNLLP